MSQRAPRMTAGASAPAVPRPMLQPIHGMFGQRRPRGRRREGRGCRWRRRQHQQQPDLGLRLPRVLDLEDHERAHLDPHHRRGTERRGDAADEHDEVVERRAHDGQGRTGERSEGQRGEVARPVRHDVEHPAHEELRDEDPAEQGEGPVGFDCHPDRGGATSLFSSRTMVK